ncbi:hypothetical protein ACFPRL_01335 [Pseudoclavibacter helvolus]
MDPDGRRASYGAVPHEQRLERLGAGLWRDLVGHRGVAPSALVPEADDVAVAHHDLQLSFRQQTKWGRMHTRILPHFSPHAPISSGSCGERYQDLVADGAEPDPTRLERLFCFLDGTLVAARLCSRALGLELLDRLGELAVHALAARLALRV